MLTAFFRIFGSEKLAYKTLQEICNNVITEIGLVSGSAVQTYTEPQAVLAVNRMFDYMVGKQQWDHLTTWDRFTLDGVTGVVTGSFEGVRDANDIKQVRPLRLRTTISRAIGTQFLDAEGNDPVYWSPIAWNASNAAKLIKFWPINATGTVDVLSLKRPAVFEGPNDIVPFDPLVIELGAAWYVLQGDGLNAGNAEKVRVMYDLAYSDLVSNQNKFEIGHGTGYRNDLVRLREV